MFITDKLKFLGNYSPATPTYFSLGAKCWLRGGVGGQFPRSLNCSNSSIPLMVLGFVTCDCVHIIPDSICASRKIKPEGTSVHK